MRPCCWLWVVRRAPGGVTDAEVRGAATRGLMHVGREDVALMSGKQTLFLSVASDHGGGFPLDERLFLESAQNVPACPRFSTNALRSRNGSWSLMRISTHPDQSRWSGSGNEFALKRSKGSLERSARETRSKERLLRRAGQTSRWRKQQATRTRSHASSCLIAAPFKAYPPLAVLLSSLSWKAARPCIPFRCQRPAAPPALPLRLAPSREDPGGRKTSTGVRRFRPRTAR